MNLKAVKISRFMKDYKKIVSIYKTSFPKVEQFPIWILRMLSHLKNVNAFAFYDENELCGFSYFLVNDETVFILYLAVNSEIRSKGYGSQILSWIKNKYKDKTIFLDVEKVDKCADNYNQRVNRIKFYEKNGIYQTNNFFTYDNVTYEILSTDKNMNEKRYNENLESYFKIFKKRRNN